LNGFVAWTRTQQDKEAQVSKILKNKPRTQIPCEHHDKIRIQCDTASRFITRDRLNAIFDVKRVCVYGNQQQNTQSRFTNMK